jgi:hypothetical protein
MMHDLICLRNIIGVLRANNVITTVTEINDTILFEGLPFDVPYKDALIDAGATYDLSYGCWVYWSTEE